MAYQSSLSTPSRVFMQTQDAALEQRRILKVRWQDHITNEEILRRAKTQPLGDIITGKRVQLAGHILRLSSQRHSKTAMTWVPPGGRRKRGRPKNTWRITFKEDLKRANIAWEEAEEAAATRPRWKLAAQCASSYEHFVRGVKETIYIRVHQPSLNRDGGRYRLPTNFDPVLTSHMRKITCLLYLG
ncbi:hypothetical protein Bbelb_332360 [Branchiostoma belcheri]|nr:hypothetical protein Bbelb_332360 [Branchiostoma belcheri]